jgi:hypothetical protein
MAMCSEKMIKAVSIAGQSQDEIPEQLGECDPSQSPLSNQINSLPFQEGLVTSQQD